MQIKALLPDSRALICDSVALEGDTVVIVVRSSESTAACPSCGHSSERIHSHYTRRLSDLPWQGLRVEVRWRSRRFFCVHPRCTRRIFTERLPEVAASYARKTNRLTMVTRAIAVACGGEEGSRLADRLGIRISPDTMLREIRRIPTEGACKVRVVGVDDWALRRGQRYGTILVDLERHRVVDVLPERSSETFDAWLRQHPEVEIVSRDRGDCYIKGADTGAQQAAQVADRWHLVHNLYEALVRVVEHFPKQLKALGKAHGEVEGDLEHHAKANVPNSSPEIPTKSLQVQQQRRARRVDRYQQAVQLREHKVSQCEIARRLGMHRSTIRQWLRAGCYPERAPRNYTCRIDRWADYLKERWQAGCHNATELTDEMRKEGFDGSYHMVCRLVRKWRKQNPTELSSDLRSARQYSPRSMAWMLFKRPHDREPEQQRLVDAFCQSCPSVARAVELAQEFRNLVTDRQKDGLGSWLKRSNERDTPAEMQRFAAGITADLAAVESALSCPWSNGQTEGQVNRLKLIKRQMYGRASFDLLRTRVLTRQP